MTCRPPNGGSFPFSGADGQAKAGETCILCVLALENLAPDIGRHLLNLSPEVADPCSGRTSRALRGEPAMFRKLALTLGSTIAIGAAALIPTSASAHMHGHHGHHGHGHWRGGFAVGIVAPTTVIASECYVVKKVVYTPFGPRVRRITVCG
jgi:hypothetical protein